MSKTAHVAQSHLWGAQVRREVDILLAATEGIGASSLLQRIATEAVVADTGALKTSTGEAGYAWDPTSHQRRGVRDPVEQRIRTAGASLGRVLCGGQPDHRSYLAFLEAIYQVTTNQDQDIAERITALWDRYEAVIEEEIAEAERKRTSILDRFWRALVAWWRHGLGGN